MVVHGPNLRVDMYFQRHPTVILETWLDKWVDNQTQVGPRRLEAFWECGL